MIAKRWGEVLREFVIRASSFVLRHSCFVTVASLVIAVDFSFLLAVGETAVFAHQELLTLGARD
jgi:hypothetical protein